MEIVSFLFCKCNENSHEFTYVTVRKQDYTCGFVCCDYGNYHILRHLVSI